jgi:hypothetical protein
VAFAIAYAIGGGAVIAACAAVVAGGASDAVNSGIFLIYRNDVVVVVESRKVEAQEAGIPQPPSRVQSSYSNP